MESNFKVKKEILRLPSTSAAFRTLQVCSGSQSHWSLRRLQCPAQANWRSLVADLLAVAGTRFASEVWGWSSPVLEPPASGSCCVLKAERSPATD